MVEFFANRSIGFESISFFYNFWTFWVLQNSSFSFCVSLALMPLIFSGIRDVGFCQLLFVVQIPIVYIFFEIVVVEIDNFDSTFFLKEFEKIRFGL